MFTRKHSPKGIVSIVALGIFALLVVFGIIVANIVNQSYNNVKNTNEYLTAKALGDSALEFLEQKLQDFGPGYNSGEITCVFNGADEEVAGGPNEGGEQNEYCAEFAAMVGDEPVTITMEIKGRAEADEKLNSENCGDGRRNLNDCYTIPLPGTGTAGKDCELYNPAFDGEGTPTVLREIAGFDGVDQVDFACNWNKLSLGSDASRSVNIPLYTQISEAIQSHPFITEPNNAQFYLRLRTPCNCEPDDQNCNQNACSPRDRYQLDPSNEVLVDWQISGVCRDEQKECGLVSSPEVPRSLLTKLQISSREAFNYVVLSSSDSKGFDNTVHPAPLGDGVFIIQKLSEMNLSKIKLMLLAKLKDRNENSIPHLEYQILANYPLSAEQIVLITNISNAGINLELKKTISLTAEIIDFAIQN